MKAALDLPLEYGKMLKDDFWPITRIAPSFENQSIDTSNICEEFYEDKHFVG